MFPPNQNDHVPNLPLKCIRCGFRSSTPYTECYQCRTETEKETFSPYPKLYYFPHLTQLKFLFMYVIAEENYDF